MPGEHVFEEPDIDLAASAVLRSPVAFAVLGLVIEKPSHGYEIWRRFQGRFGQFLGAGRSSIYSMLATLKDAGLIETMPGRSPTAVRRGPKPGPPYKATKLGARAYRGRLAERVRDDPRRVEMLGRLTLAGVHSVGAALDFLAHYERECIREATELSRPSAGGRSGGVSGLVEGLLIEERRRMIDAQLGWINYARTSLRAAEVAPDQGIIE